MSAQDGRDGSFRRIVKEACVEVAGDDFLIDSKKLAESILARLHRRELAIHDPANCVRRPWRDRTPAALSEPLGREMTLDEQIATGVLVVSDDLP